MREPSCEQFALLVGAPLCGGIVVTAEAVTRKDVSFRHYPPLAVSSGGFSHHDKGPALRRSRDPQPCDAAA
jgi:hypothetical protein